MVAVELINGNVQVLRPGKPAVLSQMKSDNFE